MAWERSLFLQCFLFNLLGTHLRILYAVVWSIAPLGYATSALGGGTVDWSIFSKRGVVRCFWQGTIGIRVVGKGAQRGAAAGHHGVEWWGFWRSARGLDCQIFSQLYLWIASLEYCIFVSTAGAWVVITVYGVFTPTIPFFALRPIKPYSQSSRAL